MDAQARVPRFDLRFGLKGLIFLMAAVAVGAAAFRDASQAWVAICTSAAVASIFFAIIAARYGRRDRQAFWTGFAIFAAAHLLLAARFPYSDALRNLGTTKAMFRALDLTHPRLNLPSPAGQSGGEQLDGDVVKEGLVIADQIIIGQSQCSLILGLLGGFLAQGLAACQPRNENASSQNCQPAPSGASDDAA